MAETVASASSTVSHTTAPLPAASPEAFTTTGAPRSRTYDSASAASLKVRCAAVGTPASTISSLAKALLASIRAASAEGPNTATPCFRKRSAIPAASGASGPTTARSMRCDDAHPASASTSPGPIGTGRASSPMPPFGWVTYSSARGASRLSLQSRACSRPPLPTTRMRMFTLPRVSSSSASAGEDA